MSTAAVARESEGGSSFFGGVDESAIVVGPSSNVACRLVALVPSASSSPKSPVAKGEASWLDVMRHEAVKIRWSDPRLELKVFEVSGEGDFDEAAFDAAVADADALVAVAFGSSTSTSSSSAALSLLSRPSAAAVHTLVPLGGGDQGLLRLARINGVSVYETTTTATTAATEGSTPPPPPPAPRPRRPLLARLPAFLGGAHRRAFDSLDAALSFWARAHSDDALTALLVLADATGKVRDPPLAALDSLKGQGLGTLVCMARNCRAEVLNCVTDRDCRAALDCLTAAPPGDQVAAYRCIVSHESKLFEDFSLCVLTKHGCLGVSAEPPRFPSPRPQGMWRGQAMTAELAETLFLGWRERRIEGGGGGAAAAGGSGGREERPSSQSGLPFDDGDDALEPWSWRVCAGQNPAYDQFNCQYQIFYRGKGKGVLWYVPVFNVETLPSGGSGDGGGGSGETGTEKKRVWRRRKYRVKRGEVPGTFWFSVLDNGKEKERSEEREGRRWRRRAAAVSRKNEVEKTHSPSLSKKKKTPNFYLSSLRRRRLQGVLDHRLRFRRPRLRPLQLQRRRERGRAGILGQRPLHARRRLARPGEARAAAGGCAQGGRGEDVGAVPGEQRLVRGGAAGDRGGG